jgi:hypothetical protein
MKAGQPQEPESLKAAKAPTGQPSVPQKIKAVERSRSGSLLIGAVAQQPNLTLVRIAQPLRDTMLDSLCFPCLFTKEIRHGSAS